jgi:hypothetical protein
MVASKLQHLIDEDLVPHADIDRLDGLVLLLGNTGLSLRFVLRLVLWRGRDEQKRLRPAGRNAVDLLPKSFVVFG